MKELKIFKDFDFSDFWDNSDYSIKNYVEDYPTDDSIIHIEKELGFKFPNSYIEFMRYQNGGTPRYNFESLKGTIEISEFLGIGKTKEYSLCGEFGNKFRIEKWGYPDTGIYICTCPSVGHDMIMLDYSDLNTNNEPKVVHIDQELGYIKKVIADDFESFIRQFLPEDYYNDFYDWSDEDTDGFDICF